MVITALFADPTPTVHTTGVNWVSIATIIIPIVVCVIAVATYLDHRTEKRQTTVKTEIKESVDQLSAVLQERLETKENVNQLKIEVASLRSSMTLGAQARFDQIEREIDEIRRKVFNGNT